MTCKCGGWGVTDSSTYQIEPCGPRCINGPAARTLRQAYDDTLKEPIPEDMKRLLDALK